MNSIMMRKMMIYKVKREIKLMICLSVTLITSNSFSNRDNSNSSMMMRKMRNKMMANNKKTKMMMKMMIKKLER